MATKHLEYDHKGITLLYWAHCHEQGLSDGAWRYRQVFSVLIALTITALHFTVQYYLGLGVIPLGETTPFKYAALTSAMAFVMMWIMFAIVSAYLFRTRCISILDRAGIEIPLIAVPKAPSFRELLQRRKEVNRQYRSLRKQHGRTQWPSFLMPLGVALLYLLFLPALHLFGLSDPGTRLLALAIPSVVAALVMFLFSEWFCLRSRWAYLHPPQRIPQPSAVHAFDRQNP